jgi:2-polyprenyl-3-methyl-5-hydroxy-6-metoxy-1,4-benzoquinol methylase
MINKNRKIYAKLVKENINSNIIKKYRTRQYPLIKYLENLDNKKVKILELGSGRGFLVKELDNKGFNIDGSDFNPINIQLAKKINNVYLKNLDAENINLKDSTYNIVISVELIEHLPNLKSHFEEVKRILKIEGLYLISTPNKTIEDIYSIFKRKNPKLPKLHVSSQTHKSLKNILQKEGFSIKFLRMNSLTNGQKDKLGFLSFFYPIKILPIKLQPSIICIAKLRRKND